tara:strand:- start:3683 stop:4300 length:618 start_codon:yes stop_codon:yes gene_type:complete
MTDISQLSEQRISNVKIFRYKFNPEIVTLLLSFSKVHQYDSKDDYKESWKLWFQNNIDILERETTRLLNLGYKGDVESKMYKASRYYFRNKSKKILHMDNSSLDNSNDSNSNDSNSSNSKRKYICLSHDLLDAMDDHIKNSINNSNFTPANGYDDFCKNNVVILASENISLQKKENLNKSDISEKFKKTYKNRYFQLRKLQDNNL